MGKIKRYVLSIVTSLLLDMDNRVEASDFEGSVHKVGADAVHGRVDDFDAASPVHRFVVDERVQVVVVYLGCGACRVQVQIRKSTTHSPWNGGRGRRRAKGRCVPRNRPRNLP